MQDSVTLFFQLHVLTALIRFQSFTNRCKVYIFCCIQRTRRTWGAAAWSWRHFDGRGAVLHPFSQNRRLDQWRNTVTLRRTNVILSDLKSKARQNILTHFFLAESTLLKVNEKMTWANKSQRWLTQSSMLAEQSATTSSPPQLDSLMAEAGLTSSLLGDRGPCPTLPELWDILTWHFTSFSYTPLYWLRNL